MAGTVGAPPLPSDPAEFAAEPTAELANAGEPRVPLHLFALKHGDTFVVADAFGDILGEGDGLFRDDTRVLSRFRLTLGGKAAVAPAARGSARTTCCSPPTSPTTRCRRSAASRRRRACIHVERARLLWEDRLYERLRLTNFAERPAVVPLGLSFAADFRDMFEVRGTRRRARGDPLPAEVTADTVLLRYRGLDGVVRASALAFSERPHRLEAGEAVFLVRLDPGARREIYVEVAGDATTAAPSRVRFRAAMARARFAMRAARRRGATIRTSGRLFNEWMGKSRADLALLTTELPTGPYPYAGIPWFSTPFGRDAIVTALQMLWLDPSLARGVLTFLARAPGDRDLGVPGRGPRQDHARDPQGRDGGPARAPVRPLLRRGRHDAAVRDAGRRLRGPHGRPRRSSGSCGPLCARPWIGSRALGRRTATASSPTPAGRRAGSPTRAGRTASDSVFHADGTDAVGPIALVEVQGYAYAAFGAMAELAERRGEPEQAAHWRARGEALRAAVEARFWVEEQGYYALALDGDGRPCRVRGSNAGHLLFAGLPTRERAGRVAAQLLAPALQLGLGHPHARRRGGALQPDVLPQRLGLAARHGAVRRGPVPLRRARGRGPARERPVRGRGRGFDMRLPELFCGFGRSAGAAPIAYPVACLPQAWASGAVFMLLQACLGLRIDGWGGTVHVDRPRLPTGIDRLTIRRLVVGGAMVDLTFQRVGDRVAVFPEGRDPSPVPLLLHA